MRYQLLLCFKFKNNFFRYIAIKLIVNAFFVFEISIYIYNKFSKKSLYSYFISF
jgi:hypothetical protein